ncbi:MAG: hypothetical protein EAZ61_09355 [Oscillatoriales cyanobacterium]|nr:MAG: hypothetical protein EAZ61_09355 [Oscillatoriales cyanobacterium]
MEFCNAIAKVCFTLGSVWEATVELASATTLTASGLSNHSATAFESSTLVSSTVARVDGKGGYPRQQGSEQPIAAHVMTNFAG